MFVYMAYLVQVLFAAYYYDAGLDERAEENLAVLTRLYDRQSLLEPLIDKVIRSREVDHVTKADIGLIGLAVMGENLVLNLAGKGFYHLLSLTARRKRWMFFARQSQGTSSHWYIFPPGTGASLEASPEDHADDQGRPPVEQRSAGSGSVPGTGDIVIDGGNSLFTDTQRRTAQLKEHGIHFVGAGVSGERKAPCTAPALCQGCPRRPGRKFDPFCRLSRRKWRENLAVSGLGLMEPVILSRWCTTALSMPICS